MRIISGAYKGRRLQGPRGHDVRPTSDRLRETLFNILGPGIRGRVFADIFSGTGAVGLEAISRGAREVVFVEQSGEGCRLIQKNLEICGVAAGYRVLRQEAFACLRQLGREGFRADVVFMDPPYRWESYSDLLDIVFFRGLAGGDSLVIVEHHRKSEMPEARQGYGRTRIVKQGDHWLSFYRSEPPQGTVSDAAWRNPHA